MAKFCQNCGSPLEGEPKFCPSCGAQVMVAPSQDAPSSQAQPTENPQPPIPASKGTAPSQGQQSMEGQPGVQNPPMQRQMPQPPMMQGQPGQPQPMMYQNAPGQGGPNAAYGMGMMGAQAFNGEHYVPDEGIKEMFLRYDNRLNRKRYIMRALALGAAVMVVCLVLGVILGMAGMSDSAIGTMGTLIGLGAGIIGLMLAIRRLHDLDRPTWWIIGNFIPFVNVIFGFYLLLAKGTEGPNQYGPDPLEGLH